MRSIRLRGARTNNLDSIDLDLRPGTLTTLCGPSGAGKSSLAFATLYAEGQRRYVESFSAYARQFLERLSRPPVDELESVPAAIAVDRGAPVKTSRSTVATMTELSDYAKQLWALGARMECPACGSAVVSDTAQSAAAMLLEQWPGERVVVTYPRVVRDAEHFLSVREALVADGYRRLWVEGAARDLDELRPSDLLPRRKAARSELQVVADRTVVRPGERARLVEALEAALEQGSGTAHAHAANLGELRFSRGLHCSGCAATYARPTASSFSFNSPVGACDVCRGFGRTMAVDWDKVIPDHGKSLVQGAIRPWGGKSTQHERRILYRYCKRAGIPVDVPVRELSAAQLASLIEGDGGSWRSGFPGLRRWFDWLQTRTYKMHVRVLLSRYRKYEVCEGCAGTRFKPEVVAWKLAGVSLPELYAMPVTRALSFVEQRIADGADEASGRVLGECQARLSTLCEVGLGYLTLDRSARTLSGGELQRVALTSALGSQLTGTLFVLDEPTVGLHPRDAGKLLPAVRRLTRDDNVVLVVESDESFLRGADRVVELGPGSGERGGQIVFDGTPAKLSRAATATARCLRGRHARRSRSRKPDAWLELDGASGNNLAGVDLRIPLGLLCCVTGVSGSGKSSLVVQTLVPALLRQKGGQTTGPLPHAALRGGESLKHVVLVDQAPLGRTSRGNPATYLGAWDAVRRRFAGVPLAVERGFTPGAFSFNVAGGRCEACKGEGAEVVEMQFLADVTFSCPHCQGRRFAGPILDVRLEGLSIADVLELTVDEAVERLCDHPDIVRPLGTLQEVGGGYLRLGQPLNALSGGEAQRLKLAAALGDAGAETLLVLDEPTAGLHLSEVDPLVDRLHGLVDAGATVVVVEHDMGLAAQADHVIDMGPDAGEEGGRIVATGTPAEVAASGASPTAGALSRALGPGPMTVGEKVPRRPRRSKASDSAVQVRGASEHNLRSVDVDIPRERLVVVTGPSGSGKSTLAFDVVFAESQRRYLETLSPYVRQYIKQLPRPAVDRVTGMPPGVSLEQRQSSGARNSTVATVTEVAHYLRLAYARAGTLHCPECEVPIAPRPLDALCADVASELGRRRVRVLAPVVRSRKGAHRDLLSKALGDGYRQARIDGRMTPLRAGMSLDRYREHDVELVLGEAGARSAELRGLLERALSMGEGTASVLAGRRELLLSSRRACAGCGRGFPELDPRFFSFNTAQGACPRCEGAGVIEKKSRRRRKRAEPAAPVTCPDCGGERLAGLALHTTLDGALITELMALDVDAARRRIDAIELTGRAAEIAGTPLQEVALRLGFLQRVGLGYLTLGRPALTLSGGEMQRVRLAAQLGSGLTGVLYVLDEPTIGLHPRDTGLLLKALRDLVGQGCSVLVVEHDADTIRSADHVIDVGPAGGTGGGRVVAEGPFDALAKNPASVTGRSLARPPRAASRRPVDDVERIVLSGARMHNLRDVRLEVPVGRFVVVSGVSGSGKSTLVREVFLPALRQALGLKSEAGAHHRSLSGADHVRRAVEIDQSPIGRTPRSVPATYVGVWDVIRRLYASTPDARARGYDASRFSFNVARGRCPDCDGQGANTVEMSFLPDALVPCESCRGLRFDPETLEVRLHGLSSGELLDTDVSEAAAVLSAVPKVHGPLELMCRLGLGYLKLGQPSNTLSGGEAQRLKLVSEMGGRTGGRTVYVMDEPTTGLHRDDVDRLLDVMQALVDRGDTLVVIEHHPDVIAAADWIVDLGPEGGEGGGRIVVAGTPADVAACPESHTGKALRDLA